MIVFVTGQESLNQFHEDAEFIDVQPLKHWQKILWELYVIELLIDILYYPFELGEKELA